MVLMTTNKTGDIMDTMKYILSGRKVMVFDAAIPHVTAAAGFVAQGLQIHGAGFVRQLQDGTWECYGRSVGLDVDSRPGRDCTFLNLMMDRNREFSGR